jgi:hypothetical protein
VFCVCFVSVGEVFVCFGTFMNRNVHEAELLRFCFKEVTFDP